MPCFRLPYVGARVPSTSMYAIGPSNSRPRPCHKGARTALMHSINVITSSSLKRTAEVASRGRIRDQVRAQRIHVRRVMAQTLDVLQPCAATQNVVRKVQHVIRLMIRQMHLQQLEAVIDVLNQTQSW